MSLTVSCGIAQYQVGDDQGSLLGRADSASYSAKAAGHNRQFLHTGTQIREQRSTTIGGGAEAPPSAENLPAIPPVDPTPVAGLEPVGSSAD